MKLNRKHKSRHAAWCVAKFRDLLYHADEIEARVAVLTRRIVRGTALAMDTKQPRTFVRVVASLNHWHAEITPLASQVALIGELEAIGLRK